MRFRVAEGIKGRPGDAPEGWKRWAEEAFHPPQPWRQLLGAAVRSAAGAPGAGENHSYRRPSRRSSAVPGVVLPSLRRNPPRVCVVIDTSGSVSDAELGSAILETSAIGRAVGGRRDLVSVVSCDAAARIVHPLCRAEAIPLLGGSGKNCSPCVQEGPGEDGGPDGSRTRDLLNAIQARSQLRYRPILGGTNFHSNARNWPGQSRCRRSPMSSAGGPDSRVDDVRRVLSVSSYA